jgi:hypothetical protein
MTLDQETKNNHWNGGNGAHRRLDTVELARTGGYIICHLESYGDNVTGSQRQSEQELRPVKDKDKEGGGQQPAPDQWKGHFDKGFKLTHAMDPGNSLQIYGNLFDKTANHPDAEGKSECRIGQDQTEMSIG